MDSKFICHNEKFLLSSESSLPHNNRAFCYGDALFETIHCLGTEPQLFDRHWARLLRGIKALKMDVVEGISEEYFRSYIRKLLNKNRIFKGARIRLTVYRDQGGLYTPEKNSVSWLLESSALKCEKYELNQKGLAADIFDEVHKPINKLSNLKTTNALIYVLAGLYKNVNNLNECFVLNQYGRIAECISSNVFLVFENKIVTPPLTEGCISGVMREVILETITAGKINLEERPVLVEELKDAEEIFVTNAIQGIQWIGAYKNRRYFNFMVRKLLVELNKREFES